MKFECIDCNKLSDLEPDSEGKLNIFIIYKPSEDESNNLWNEHCNLICEGCSDKHDAENDYSYILEYVKNGTKIVGESLIFYCPWCMSEYEFRPGSDGLLVINCEDDKIICNECFNRKPYGVIQRKIEGIIG